MTFEEAIRLGEYKPEILAQFPEWTALSRHAQWEYIAKAIANRKRQLMDKWAEVINFTTCTPETKKQMADNIFAQIAKLEEEKERLYYQYSFETYESNATEEPNY